MHARSRAASRSRLRYHRAGGLRRRRLRCAGPAVSPPPPGPTTRPTAWRSAGIASSRSTCAPPRCHVRCPWTALCCGAAARQGRHAGCAARLPADPRSAAQTGAVAPQHALHRRRQVRIDGVPAAAALPADRLGRPLPSLQLCRRLEPGELFLLSVTNPACRFDSRFRPVSASAVIGIAHPVWLDTPMMAADSLHVAVPLIVPSSMSFQRLPRRVVAQRGRIRAAPPRNIRRSHPACRRLSNASACGHWQPSPARWLRSAAQRRRAADARSDSEGKGGRQDKRFGTLPPAKPVCIGWRGTAASPPCRVGREARAPMQHACFARGHAGACREHSHDRPRRP